MTRLIAIILLFATIQLTYALYENYTMYSISGKNLSGEKLRNILSSKNIKLVEEPGLHKKGLIISGPSHTARFLKYLNDNQVNYKVVTRDLYSYLNQQKSEDLSFRSANSLEKYNTYEEIKAMLSEWSKLPHVSVRSIGESVEKRTIPMIEINVSSQKPAFLLECGIHAREWISPATCLNFAYTMIKSPCESIKKVSLYIVPVFNPDGYVKSHTTDRLHRKNCGHPHPVDLNRNFDAGWREDEVEFESYPGPKPFSEPESRVMKKLVQSLGDKLIFYLGTHSYGQMAMYSYAYKEEKPKTVEMLHKIVQKGAEIFECQPKTGCKRDQDSRYKYRFGTITDVIYQAYGSSIDWVYDSSKSGRKAAVAIELPPDHFGGSFILPAKYISPVNKSFVPAVCGMVEERLKFDDKYFI